MDSDEQDTDPRVSRGEPLLVWGEYDGDALRPLTYDDLTTALDALQSIAQSEPLVARLWSVADDQVLVVLNGFECALYVLSSTDGYGTSIGDPSRGETFDVADHRAGTLYVPWSDCIEWRHARDALVAFAYKGSLGETVPLAGSIPSTLLMGGEITREIELETRREPATDPALSSLPMKTPAGQWATRLLSGLIELHLIEIESGTLPAVTSRVSILLGRLGDDAQDSAEVAQQLSREIAKVPGVTSLFATGGDLQIALRRTQDPPTMPIETPFA